MSAKVDRRIGKLESGLTPKQAILLWLQEAHTFGGIEVYVRYLKTQPDNAAPLRKLTNQVEEGVKQTLKGKPREEIDRAVRQAYKDVLFLFFLNQQVNGKLVTEERHYWSQAMLLTNMLGSLLREQTLDERIRGNQVLQIEKPDGNYNRLRQRVTHWTELAKGFLVEIYTVRQVIDSINSRYFDRQESLFPAVAEGFDQLLTLVEKTVDIYNESLAVEPDYLARLVVETKYGQDEPPLTVDPAALIEGVEGAAREQVAYLVDMAKANALDVLGEPENAVKMVERYV